MEKGAGDVMKVSTMKALIGRIGEGFCKDAKTSGSLRTVL
jgi:hypothetical protein